MSKSITGLPPSQVLQMREHLACHYYPRYRTHLTYPELREVGQDAMDATLATSSSPSDPQTMTILLYRQMKEAIVHYGQAAAQRRS